MGTAWPPQVLIHQPPLYCDADHALARLQQLGLLLRLVVSDTYHPAEKQLTQ